MSARRSRRFWLACLLTGVAVAAPCAAWYVAGSRAAHREAGALRQRPLERGNEIAIALSERLLGRLEAMRDSESQRPVYHYQGSFHDPTSSCQCASQTPSPLSAGPRDPFIATHFQIDPARRLSLPSLSPESPETRDADFYQRQRELELELQASVDACFDALGEARLQTTHGRRGTPAPPAAARVAPEEWLEELSDDEKALRLEAFQWHGVPVGGDSLLVALRRLNSEEGVGVQGFVLSHPAVEAWLRSAEFPATLRPAGGPVGPGTVTADLWLDCTQWEIAVDVSEAVLSAQQAAASIEAGFLRSFSLGSIAALLAGGAVVLLLWRTERMARDRARFAASAAHELRTPLAGLRLYGDMLAGDLGDPGQTQRYAQRISEEAERLGRVVTNVLGFTRLERGQLDVRVEPGDLVAAVSEILERLAPTVEGGGASILFEPAAASVPARFDRDALEHMLQNLVDNAEKYSREASDRRIHVGVASVGDVARLSVRDHGPGVSAEVARRLFRPFERGVDRNGPAGLGLGLVLVRNLARAHGSDVGWRNHAEGGAEFWVEVPGVG